MKNIDTIPRNLTSWVHPELILKESKIEGYGLFATKKIPQNTIISVFGGRVYSLEEMNKMAKGSYVLDNSTQLNQDFFLGPLSEESVEWGFFINHSCAPNTMIKESVFLISISDIEIGEEISFDYGHSHNNFLNIKCHCGSYSCRGYISNEDYLNKDYQKNNIKFFAKWLKERISEN